MITVWNNKPVAQDLLLTLYYHGGHYKIPIHLEALQSYNLDMMDLVRRQVPDPDGTVIPPNATSGSGLLAGPGGDSDKISVSIASSVFNVRNATCGEGCTTCNGATTASLNPGSYSMGVGGSQPAQFQITWNTGSVYTNPYGTTWSTGNGTIATVDSGGMLTGQAVGQTTVSAYAPGYPVYSMNCSGDGQGGCPDGDLGGGGPTTVSPSIASISPAEGLVGTAINVTINGSGFAAGATVSAGSNISVSNVNVASSTEITATFTPSNSTSAGGNQGVAVTFSEQTSNSKNFFVQYPKHIVYIDQSYTPNGGHSTTVSGTDINIVDVNGNTLAYGVCGGYQWLSYILTDQIGNRIVNGTVIFSESFSNFSPSPDPFGVPTPGAPFSANLDGDLLVDTYALYRNTGCPPRQYERFFQPAVDPQRRDCYISPRNNNLEQHNNQQSRRALI